MSKTGMISLKFIHENMAEDKPSLYKMYNQFMGVKGSLSKKALQKIKAIAAKEYKVFVEELNTAIKEAEY